MLTICILLLQDMCFAFVATAVMYADQFLLHKEKPCEASVQELMDHLHIHWPPNGFVLDQDEVPWRGLPNTFPHAFEYVKNFGLFSADEYPFVQRVQDYRIMADIDSVRNNAFTVVY